VGHAATTRVPTQWSADAEAALVVAHVELEVATPPPPARSDRSQANASGGCGRVQVLQCDRPSIDQRSARHRAAPVLTKGMILSRAEASRGYKRMPGPRLSTIDVKPSNHGRAPVCIEHEAARRPAARGFRGKFGTPTGHVRQSSGAPMPSVRNPLRPQPRHEVQAARERNARPRGRPGPTACGAEASERPVVGRRSQSLPSESTAT